jgi:hypothetical protein
MDPKAAMAAFYDERVRELADQQPKKVREQMQAAFLKTPPASPDDVDAWFEASFHKAPVSHDTMLFNQLQGMKAWIRDALTPKADEAA